MDQKIRNDVVDLKLFPIEKLTPFQGDLKDLSKENYERMKLNLLELGFSEPMIVWDSPTGLMILNGHQRHRVMTQMKAEGFKIPQIPCVIVKAKDETEAKKKVLALTSQYGEITKEGLYEFITNAGIDFKSLEKAFHFPDINFETFNIEFFENGTAVDISTLQDEWTNSGMPDFSHTDKSAFKSVIVHFANEAEFQNFAKLINQALTLSTKSIWFPKRPEKLNDSSLVYE